jgi:O-antigen/teichoic acid export membrane protein
MLKKFLSFSYGTVLGILVGFVTTPVLTRLFSPEEYGKATLLQTYANLLAVVCTIGLDQSYVRFFNSESEPGRARLLRYCLKWGLVALTVVTVGVTLFARQMFPGSGDAWDLVALTLFAVLSQLLYRYAVLLVRMNQNGNFFSVLELLNRVLNFVVIVIYAFAVGSTYLGLILAFIVVNFVLTATVYLRYRRQIRCQKGTILEASPRELFRFGIFPFATVVVTWAFQSLDKLFLSQYGSYADLGVYTAGFKLVAILNVLQTTFSTFWHPVSIRRYEEAPDDLGFFKNVAELMAFVMLMLGLVAIAAKDLVVILLGPKFSGAAVSMPFLVFMPMMQTISEATVIGIALKKKTVYDLWIALVVLGVSLVLDLSLIPFWGAKGAAIATGITFIVLGFAKTFFGLRLFDFGFSTRNLAIGTVLVAGTGFLAMFQSDIAVVLLASALSGLVILFLYREVVLLNLRKLQLPPRG